MQYRAKNDIYNSIYAGLIAGGVLGRNSGPRAMVLGGKSGAYSIREAVADFERTVNQASALQLSLD